MEFLPDISKLTSLTQLFKIVGNIAYISAKFIKSLIPDLFRNVGYQVLMFNLPPRWGPPRSEGILIFLKSSLIFLKQIHFHPYAYNTSRNFRVSADQPTRIKWYQQRLVLIRSYWFSKYIINLIYTFRLQVTTCLRTSWGPV